MDTMTTRQARSITRCFHPQRADVGRGRFAGGVQDARPVRRVSRTLVEGLLNAVTEGMNVAVAL